jgi:aliphatic sulfonates family ABC transporter substrate-binding protein
MPVLTLPQQSSTSLPTLRAKALVFEAPESRAVLERIERIAPSDATVLITGETGSGKEIIARHIHHLSHRNNGPFVAVNCGALSEHLVESELFGHERGAFTGAQQSKAGWFEVADGGTLFLDEIGDLPLPAQVKLLRVLQEHEVVRVGSRKPVPTNVRLIAATNVDLLEAMVAGHFREDLYYRLNVAVVDLPPLRERLDDIQPLVTHFLETYQRRLSLGPITMSEGAWQKVKGYSWPGNIRELENAVHHALLVCRNGTIQAEDVRLNTNSPSRLRPPSTPPPSPNRQGFDALESVLRELFELGSENLYERVEQTLLKTAYQHCERNQLQTARLLGISRNVVRARLIQYGELSGHLRSTPPASDTSSIAAVDASIHAPRAGGESRHPVAPVDCLRIGYQTFGQLLLAKALGYIDRELSSHGTSVEWIEFPGGMQLIDSLQGGFLDIGVVGECPPVFAQAAEVPFVYFACEKGAPEAEAIIVPRESRITDIKQLAGRRVALNRGANVHYLLIQALEQARLTYDDVHPIFMAPAEAERAFRRGEVDAWAIWEPLLSSVQKRTGARVLCDGTGLTENGVYYVAQKKLATNRPEVLAMVSRCVLQATDYAKRNPAATAKLLNRHNDIDREVLERWVANQSTLLPLDPVHLAAQQTIADRFYGLNLLPRRVRVEDACWHSP